MKLTFAIFIALAVVSHLALAQSPRTQATAAPSAVSAASSDDINAPPRHSAGNSAVGNESQTVKGWDYWYTVMVNKKTPYEYYHESVETKEGRLIYKLHAWKKEEGFINEEQLGAFAQASDLAPLFFNFHSTYRGTEKTIDGNVQDKGLLVVKIVEGGSGGSKEQPLIRRSLSKNIFLSSFFPLWLARQSARLKPNRALSFTSILEDGGDGTPFANTGGSVKPTPEAGKFEVDFRGQKSFWWMDDQGVPARIEMPKSHAVVERVSEAKAKAFLNTSGPSGAEE